MANPSWVTSRDNAASAITAGHVINLEENAVEGTATNITSGVIMSDASAGEHFPIAKEGIVPVIAADASSLSIGDEVAPAANGEVDSAVTTNYVCGIVREIPTDGIYGDETVHIELKTYLI